MSLAVNATPHCETMISPNGSPGLPAAVGASRVSLSSISSPDPPGAVEQPPWRPWNRLTPGVRPQRVPFQTPISGAVLAIK